MDVSPLLLLSGCVVLMAASLTMFGLSRRNVSVVNIDDRLAAFGADRVASLERRELEASFGARVIKPMLRKWMVALGGRMPNRQAEETKNKLMMAGNPGGLGVVEFMGLRALMAIGLGTGSFLLLSLAGSIDSALMFGLVLAFFGYLMPSFWLGRRMKRRKKEITRSLPDAIDLLTISVESGLGFDPALMRVAEKWDNALTREFARVLSEMRIGKAKRDALREMTVRCGVDDLTVFVSSVIQADQLGVAISQVLRIQSEAMRVRRRQRAEEAAHKAPIKMLIPMAFLIFPALYVVILGPAIPQAIEAFK